MLFGIKILTKNETEEADLDEACSDYDEAVDDSDNDHFDPSNCVGEYVDFFPPSDEEEDKHLGTARTKIMNTTQQPVPEDDAGVLSIRRQQRRVSKQRALTRANLSLRGERLAARTWKPKRLIPCRPVVGISTNAKWKHEQLIKAHTAHLAVHKRVNIHQNPINFQMTCHSKSCRAVI